MAKLRLGFYPYTYARVSVMKSELIRPPQWQNLLKMGANEILRYLQDGGYKTEIDELGADQRDLAALEMTMNRNLMRTCAKLKRISDEKVQEVLRVYLQRYDMENFKTIIRGKMTGIEDEEIGQVLMPSVNYPKEYFTGLLEKEKVEDVLEALPFDIHVDANAELFQIENELDRTYFGNLFELSKRLAGQGEAMKEFIRAELAILNIKMILRMKREQFKKEEIAYYLIHPDLGIEKLVEKETVRDMMKALHKMGYTSITGDESLPEEERVTQLEAELDTTLLKKEVLLMHQFPLTVNVILGFMFAKEIEVKNLKVLVKGKRLGLQENYLSTLLAVA